MSPKRLSLAVAVALSTSLAARAAVIVDGFVSPATAAYIGANSNLVQAGVSDIIPGSTRNVYNVQHNGTWSHVYSGAALLHGDNYGGATSVYVNYGHVNGTGVIGDLTTGGQDRFRLTVENIYPARGAAILVVSIYDAAVQLVESEQVPVPQVGGSQTVDLLYSQFSLVNFANVATVQLQFYQYNQPDYSYFDIDRFETFGAIPEPASVAVLALAALALARRRR